jgi:signal recognition particle subunit SRP19
MRKEKNKIRLFPEYFDKDVSRRNGRRLPKNKSIKDPKLLELKIAAQKMSLETEENKTASYPTFPTDKRGMLIVTVPDDYELKKTGVIKRISELTVSFSRPLIEEKLKAEKEKADKKRDKQQNRKDFGKKGSDKPRKDPKPRRR